MAHEAEADRYYDFGLKVSRIGLALSSRVKIPKTISNQVKNKTLITTVLLLQHSTLYFFSFPVSQLFG